MKRICFILRGFACANGFKPFFPQVLFWGVLHHPFFMVMEPRARLVVFNCPIGLMRSTTPACRVFRACRACRGKLSEFRDRTSVFARCGNF